MIDHLPPSRVHERLEVFDAMVLWPLERITSGLRKGHGYDLRNLRPLANRCRALADAFDERMKEVNDDPS